MKRLFATLPLITALCCASSAAFADEEKVPFKLGVSGDVALTSGASIGLEARLRHVPWLKGGFSVGYLFAPNYHGNLLVDPIKFPIAPVANFDLGHQTEFTLPGVQNSPSVNFTHFDLEGGLAAGKRDGARFLLLFGATHLNGNVYNLQRFVNVGDGITLGDPHFSLWAPCVKIGFEVLL